MSCFFGQGTLKEYENASKFMGYNLSKLYYNQYVNPVWNEDSTNFTYAVNTRKGTEYFLVNSKTKSQKQAFSQENLCLKLNERFKKSYEAYKLPIKNIYFSKNCQEFSFSLDTLNLKYSIKDKKLSDKTSDKAYSNKEIYSNDNSKILIWDNHNLSIKDLKTNIVSIITKDGNQLKGYGSAGDWYEVIDQTDKQEYSYSIEAYWSTDSKKIIVPVFDRQKTMYMDMLQWEPNEGLRPHHLTYERAMPGETDLTTVKYVIIDVASGKMTDVQIPSSPDFLGTYVYWSTNGKAYKIDYERGYTSRKIIEINAESGEVKTILTDETKTSVDVALEYFLDLTTTNEFVWMSEKDGWNHLFLGDLKTGKIKSTITTGNYVVRSVEWVDEKGRIVYFMACGVNETEDAYFKKLYRINFDGTGLKCLSIENADHTVTLSPDHSFFIDNYSRIDLPNTGSLKKLKDGTELLVLAKGDVTDLVALGWSAPEAFKVKGRDGKTDIYGVIYRPFNFDPTKKYPVIDGTYSGPHTIRSPKTFRKALVNDDVPLAQLGFVVVNIDGMGSAFRSKDFRSKSWKNLGDIGCEDHIIAIKEMAKKYSYIDTTRVGIYGHSAGGYDAVRALIIHPEFYKVSVSSAGCHDLKIDKVWWPEHHMGLVGPHYDEQSNIVNAAKIKGKLLLVHGDIDNNVNPVASIRLSAEMIKNNMDFDLLIVPGHDHYTLYNDKYFIRKRWDFFVENLIGVVPPKEFKIK
jgi:dipeptidyl aminopeptidase/acylaminoacyl peptidase